MQGRRPTPESEQNGEAREVKNLFSETHPMQGAVSGPRKRTKRRTQEGRPDVKIAFTFGVSIGRGDTLNSLENSIARAVRGLPRMLTNVDFARPISDTLCNGRG